MTREQLDLLLRYINTKVFVAIGSATNQRRSNDTYDSLDEIVNDLQESVEPTPFT